MNPIKRIWQTAIAAWHNRLSSDDRPHYETAPEDRISFTHKVIYGLGAFVNNLLAGAIGGMIFGVVSDRIV